MTYEDLADIKEALDREFFVCIFHSRADLNKTLLKTDMKIPMEVFLNGMDHVFIDEHIPEGKVLFFKGENAKQYYDEHRGIREKDAGLASLLPSGSMDGWVGS